MAQLALLDDHPARRHLRMLGANLVFSTPVRPRVRPQDRYDPRPATPTPSGCCATASWSGSSRRASRASASRSPERYKLQRFGRGGFVSAALRTRVPIIPVSIVGAEEIYPMLGNAETLARLLGLPYFPITPTFPWLGPLGMVPLPSKWIIEFGEPIRTDNYPGGRPTTRCSVFNLTDQVARPSSTPCTRCSCSGAASSSDARAPPCSPAFARSRVVHRRLHDSGTTPQPRPNSRADAGEPGRT